MNTTVVIVSFKSEHLIKKNIEHFDYNTPIIIVDNSYNVNLKKTIEDKYNNVKVLLNNNCGFGQAANLGASLATTKYIFFCSPDNFVEQGAIYNLEHTCKDFNDEFGLLVLTDKKKIIKEIKKIYTPCGISCFFIKKKTFFDLKGFDENFFLYYEDTDLIKRFLDKKHNIYQVPINYSNFFGSHNKLFSTTIEINRNWHYMWSKFYYRRKHFGYLYALISTLPYFLRSLLKVIININKIEKKNKYLARLGGLYNSYILKKSWYRPKI